MHDAAFAGAFQTLKLMLLWRTGASENLKKEFEKRGVEALQASWAAGQTVWSLERETVHGETALDLAKLAHVQVLSTTPDGLLKVRLSLGSEWTRYFVIFGALLGIFAGNMLGGLEGAGVAVGLALGLFLGWVFAFLANFASKGCQGKKSKEKAKQAEKAEVALALTSASAAAAKASSDDDTTADTSTTTTSSSLLTPQERKLAALAQVVQDLEQAGARSAVQRWLNVNWRGPPSSSPSRPTAPPSSRSCSCETPSTASV